MRAFNDVHAAAQGAALARLQQVAAQGGNVFAELMETVQVGFARAAYPAALYAVGGQYRRNM